MPKYNLTGTEQIPDGAFVNLAAAGRVVDQAGVAHHRLIKGQSIQGCEVPDPERLQAAVAAGQVTMQEIPE